LNEKSIIYSKTNNSKTDITTIISITDLIKNIKFSPYFQSFKKTFEVLLQEPNMLNDYYLLDESSYEKIINSSNNSNDTCTVVSELRNALVFFWAMLDKISHKELRESIHLSLNTIIQSVTYLYQGKHTNLKVKNTLLPLLNHFEDAKSQLFVNIESSNIGSSELVVSKQLILSTIISLDYHELNNCKVTGDNAILSKELKGTLKSMEYGLFDFPEIKKEIEVAMTKIRKITAVNKLSDGKSTNDVQNKQMFTDIIKQLDEEDSDRTKFYSYVYEKKVLNMCQDLHQDIKTIDNHQIVNFQLTVLEWYLSQAYTKVLCMFKFPNDLSEELIIFIGEDLEKLKNLTFSTYLMRIVRDFVIVYLDYFEDNTNYPECIEQFTDMVNVQFKAFNVSINEFQFSSINDVYMSFKNDIDFIQLYFIDTNDNKLMVDENKLPMSMFLDE